MTTTSTEIVPFGSEGNVEKYTPESAFAALAKIAETLHDDEKAKLDEQRIRSIEGMVESGLIRSDDDVQGAVDVFTMFDASPTKVRTMLEVYPNMGGLEGVGRVYGARQDLVGTTLGQLAEFSNDFGSEVIETSEFQETVDELTRRIATALNLRKELRGKDIEERTRAIAAKMAIKQVRNAIEAGRTPGDALARYEEDVDGTPDLGDDYSEDSEA